MPVTQPEPIVVYAMVLLLAAAMFLGLFFASPLRERLTGPDDAAASDEGPPAAVSDEEAHETETGAPPPAMEQPGPWSTEAPRPDWLDRHGSRGKQN